MALVVSFISALVALGALAVAGLALARLRRGEPDAGLRPLADSLARLEAALRDESLRSRTETNAAQAALRQELGTQLRGFQDSIQATLASMQGLEKAQLEVFANRLNEGVADVARRLAATEKTLEDRLAAQKTDQAASGTALRGEVQASLKALTDTLSRAQEVLRVAVEQRLEALRADNSEKLEKMRRTVDDQLKGTLEARLGESFKLVSERLEQVYKGLGEMQNLAGGVGDLKRMLTNVKVRGSWGEVQLGSLLEQVLTPDQYLKDAATDPEGRQRVEYAVRLPGRDDGSSEVLLPVDSKFPNEDYERLTLAAEKGDAPAVEAAGLQLERRALASAAEIRDKYINPPRTTDFAVMFLPTEGLYAEVLRRPGLAEKLQREYHVTPAGPTTLAAMLNALRMGFRTLAIQKRSGEVWRVLEAVKTEFGNYGKVLAKVQKKLTEASNSINEVEVRQRAVDRKLRAVGEAPEQGARELLGLDGPAGGVWDEGEGDAEGEESRP